jgi:hypothetical protein
LIPPADCEIGVGDGNGGLMKTTDVLRRPDGRLGPAIVGCVVIVSAAIVAQAWSGWNRIGPGWKVGLIVGSAMTIGGIVALALHRYSIAGIALCVAAFLLPTGYGVILNIVLLILALPLLAMREGTRPRRAGPRSG